MKYIHGAQVKFPYLAVTEDGETERIWTTLTFKGTIDRRRLKREVRKWILRNVGRKVTWELYEMLKRVTPLEADTSTNPAS